MKVNEFCGTLTFVIELKTFPVTYIEFKILQIGLFSYLVNQAQIQNEWMNEYLVFFSIADDTWVKLSQIPPFYVSFFIDLFIAE